MILGIFPPVAAASSWSPTLLVNTESFEIIDDGSGSTNIELRFGDSANEILRWDISNARFQFTDDVHVEGNITGSGTLTVDGAVKTKGDITLNSDQGAADTVLTFGSDTTNETMKFLNNEDRFELSDDLRVTGGTYASGALIVDGAATFKSTVKINGVTYTFPAADGSNGYVLTTNAAGTLSWSSKTEGSVTQSDGDARYVNQSGDTMTGSLTIANNGVLNVSGAILSNSNLTINSDNGAANAVLTFGNDAGVETITFNDATNEFDISDDVNVTGTFDATSTITTNADLTINADNGAADAVLTFGSDGTAETATFANATDRFDFSDDIHTTGNLTASGTLTVQGATVLKSTLAATDTITTNANLTINADNGAADAVLTFGSDGTAETATFANATDRFDFSDDIHTTGNLTASGTLTVQGATVLKSTLKLNGVTYTFPTSDGSASGKVLKTNSAGQLSWSADIDTDTNTTYSAGEGLSLVGTLFKLTDTVSGTLLQASTTLASSGNLVVENTTTLNGATTVNSTLDTTGNITTDGNLTINEDNGAANAVLTFGNDAGVETITFNDATNEFDISDDVNVTGTFDATSTITTNADLTINADNGAADAVLTFGSDGTAETLTFANTSDRFELSDDVYATGVVRAHGGLSGASLRVDGGSVSINGVAYSFTNTDGSAGQVLRTDGAGNLTWSSLANGSGNTVFLSPEYPNAVYFASGSSFIGQLYASGGNLTNLDNSYAWSSTNASIQDYWVSTRVKIPHNFSTWAPTPIQFRFRTGTDLLSQNHLTMKFYDTTGTQIALGTGALAGTSWTTANITGPQASGTYTPDSYITIMVKLAANNTASAKAHAGSISLNWRTTTP